MGFHFVFCNLTNAPIVFSSHKQGATYAYTHFDTLSKNAHENGNNVNPKSKKFKFSRFLGRFMFRQNTLEKWKKNNPS